MERGETKQEWVSTNLNEGDRRKESEGDGRKEVVEESAQMYSLCPIPLAIESMN